jgi:competence protein ComEC
LNPVRQSFDGIFFSSVLNFLKTIPFLRIFAPFASGILIAVSFAPAQQWPYWLLMALCLPTAVCLSLIKKQESFSRGIFLVCCDVFLFCAGSMFVFQTDIRNHSDYFAQRLNSSEKNQLLVTVDDLPVEKEKYLKCQVEVKAVKSDSAFEPAEGNIIVYLKKPFAKQIRSGQQMLLSAEVKEIDPPKNPYEFDYRQYMGFKQVRHSCFADSTSCFLLSGREESLLTYGADIKQSILHRLKNSALSRDAYAICAALITGYDDDIDDSVMEAFSHSGTVHVLSVSGLHTGLIYLLLSFLFDLFDRNKKFRISKFIFITVCLWFMALVTGFAPPILRAVIMFNLLGVGKIFFRNDHRNQVNILLVSAFILLCIDPFWIRDIGFQLSYFALLGILIFQPVFSRMWQPENRFTNYTWQSVTASFAATLTTLPFTLFYFKQFPIWFFLCNLVVVPFSFAILLLAVLVVFKLGFASIIINYLVSFMFGFIALFNHSWGFIDNVDFRWSDAILLSLFIVLFSSTLHKRSFRLAVASVLTLIAWQINGIADSWQSKNTSGFTVYQVNKENAFTIKNKTEAVMDTVSREKYNFHVRPHVVSFNYPELSVSGFNSIYAGREEILLLGKKGFWPEADYSKVSILVVSNNFRLTEADLGRFISLKKIVCDGSNNRYIVGRLSELCDKFGIEFYNTKEKGALITPLKGI